MTDKIVDIVPGLFIGLAFDLFLITWIVEIVLSATWDKRYFGAGIPLFVFHVPLKDPYTNIPNYTLLENNFRLSSFVRNTSLSFKELDTNTMAFRESLLQFGGCYSIKHGLLIFDNENSRVVVKGFINLTAIYF